MKIKKQNKAFSLVELLVVITIIAILSVVAYTAVGGQTAKARDSKRKEDLGAIQSALEIYAIENGNQFPGDIYADLSKQMPKGVPTDPGNAGHNYIYRVNGNDYEVAATLEGEGDIANYATYTVGNANGVAQTVANPPGKYNNSGALANCSAGRTLQAGTIGTSDANNNCVPYDPHN